jgi:hypothetical protein
MLGDIPGPRFGHTLTKVETSNRALLFGGLNTDQREKAKLGGTFSQVSAEGCMYTLDMDTMTWTEVKT